MQNYFCFFLKNILFYFRSDSEESEYAEIRDCCGSDNMLSGLRVCSEATEASDNKCAVMEDQERIGVSLTEITGCCCHEEL